MSAVIPYSLKDAPALIERLLPVQKLSTEAYKEQMAVHGKTLTALGSYWKGRKPLVLNKACLLGCLLPATTNLKRDLEIFEKLMAMDDESFVARWPRRPSPKEILAAVSIHRIADYFTTDSDRFLPDSAPVDWAKPEYKGMNVAWRDDVSELERRRLEFHGLPKKIYRERVDESRRAEEVDNVHDHIWESVNAHLGTAAGSFPELMEQLGTMRFGHRPRVADTFCGSGQIPFEAARLGCDVHASDLNPVACMLTWGAFNIVGGTPAQRAKLERQQRKLAGNLQAEVDKLGIETDGRGWRAKVFLYCVEVRCPQTGWLVPLLPTRVISNNYSVIADIVPDKKGKRYDIQIRSGVSSHDFKEATKGTVRSDGRGQDPYLLHTVDGREYRTKISTLRGDFRGSDSPVGNKLRQWEKTDFRPRSDDLFQERLYAVQWMRRKGSGKSFDYEFRSVADDDLRRERIVDDFVRSHLIEWQEKGWIPDMRIESGYNTDQPIRERGWTYWHHLFTPRHLIMYAACRRDADACALIILAQLLNCSSRLSRWAYQQETVNGVFDNQALNTLSNYGVRAVPYLDNVLSKVFPHSQIPAGIDTCVRNMSATELTTTNDIYITDPPYGDAVNYHEILEYFIAWIRKIPPPEFADWIWDSRRSLAVKGDDEEFRRGMVAAYRRMSEFMPENGIQVVMFTHQSSGIWADMANIVWASGLQVTAAWYVATERDSALREGSYVKGTVLLVLRKRRGTHKTTRDELAWEIQEEVEAQVGALTGLNQEAKGLYRDENVFEDADIQMAGYAAALRVLTRYAIIDGRDMPGEAIRPRVKGETTFVDGLIEFAVATANQSLVPQGIPKSHWDRLTPPERFYLKLIDLEARGAKTLDNYQNFAKALKVRDFRPLMASQKANQARLRSAVEFGKAEMNEGSELHQSALRAVLYAMMELVRNVDGTEVLAHLVLNVPNYYGDMTRRALVVELSDYLAKKLEILRPEEASAARVLREMLKNQRLG